MVIYSPYQDLILPFTSISFKWYDSSPDIAVGFFNDNSMLTYNLKTRIMYISSDIRSSRCYHVILQRDT